MGYASYQVTTALTNPDGHPPGPEQNTFGLFMIIVLVVGAVLLLLTKPAVAGTSLPGEDASDKLQAAGTLLRLVDTGLFKWGARIFAGVCIMSSAWALKEQRFGIAVICVIGAIVFGTAPTWVKNIFDIGGNQGLFSSASEPQIEAVAQNSASEVEAECTATRT